MKSYHNQSKGKLMSKLIVQDREEKQTRPKCQSLYNIQDYLPKQQNFKNNIECISKPTTSIMYQPMNKFYTKTLHTEANHQDYNLQDIKRNHKNQINNLKQEIDTLKNDKDILRQQNINLQQQIQKILKQNKQNRSLLQQKETYIVKQNKINQSLSTEINQLKKIIEQFKQKQIRRRRDIKIWYQKYEYDYKPEHKQKYTISCQTQQQNTKISSVDNNKIFFNKFIYPPTSTNYPTTLKFSQKLTNWNNKEPQQIFQQKKNKTFGSNRIVHTEQDERKLEKQRKKSWKQFMKNQKIDIYPIHEKNLGIIIETLLK